MMIYPYVLEFTKCAVQGVTIVFSFFYPTGKAGGAQILRYQGIAVNYYGFTLGALALIPSGFCNDGANSTNSTNQPLQRLCVLERSPAMRDKLGENNNEHRTSNIE